MKKFGYYLMMLVFAGFVACNDDDDLVGNLPADQRDTNTTNTEQTIAEVAIGTPQFSILVDALIAANLVDLFTQPGNFTVFAPTNDAFTEFLADNGFASLADIPADLLQTVLLYHVVGSRLNLNSGFSSNYVSSLAKASNDNNLSLYLSGSSSLNVNLSSIDKDNISTSNGFIYAIDEVLVPQRITDFIAMNKSLSTLGEATVHASLFDLIRRSEGITIFAPLNDAFESFFDDLGISSITDILPSEVAPILTSHVVSGYVLSSQLSSGDVSTLNPDKQIEVRSSGRIIELDGREIDVITADIQAINGVIHTINGVILP